MYGNLSEDELPPMRRVCSGSLRKVVKEKLCEMLKPGVDDAIKMLKNDDIINMLKK